MTGKTVAIANRGEIAKRIVITCREMGLKSVLLYAAGDTQNEAFRLADERLCIGPKDPLQSYLSIEANIKGALASGAQALHPGYGFLSENPLLAKQCEEKGLIFIGPSSEAITSFSDKVKAKQLCEKAGIPVLPYRTGTFKKTMDGLKAAESLGYPLVIKALSGGGGRGLRIAHNPTEFLSFLSLVKQEVGGAFHNKGIFLEKCLKKAKHIEVQVFVDAAGQVFVLGDRDCSVQRRHQKIIEEAPSGIPKAMKKQMKETASTLLQLVKYRGAGTVEFLYYEGEFYFLEMNPRLQVEHTVTEMIFGLDLVRAQILTAFSHPVFVNETFKPKGHSIQCRICAEDPFNQFLPVNGKLLSCSWPLGIGKRMDTGFSSGDTISLDYDSLIAKIIVHDASRIRAIEKMRQTLEETIIFGCPSNIPFLKHFLCLPEFLEDKISIDFIEKTYPNGMDSEPLPFEEDFLKQLCQEIKEKDFDQQSFQKKESFTFNPWSDFLKS